MKALKLKPKLSPLGDNGVIVEFESVIREDILNHVQSLHRALASDAIKEIIESVPSYHCLTIYYYPMLINYANLTKYLAKKINALDVCVAPNRQIRIPVLYDGADLSFVSQYTGFTIDEIIKRHTTPHYTVYMLGFSPGFPYIGGMDSNLIVPRKKKPAKSVTAGAVGIADRQTGVYTTKGPSGWQIIGRTPFNFFDIDKTPPARLKAGDKITFYAIDYNEFEAW